MVLSNKLNSKRKRSPFFFMTPPCVAEMWVRSLDQEDPLKKEMTTHSIFLPGKSHGRRSLVSYSPWGRKESDMTERLHFTINPNDSPVTRGQRI